MVIKTPKDAELNAAEAMRSWGYMDAESPKHGADGGIDVRSSKALAQVKMRGSKAGQPELQNLYGASASERDKALMFFDLKGYSPQAVAYANKHGIGLYVYDTSGAVMSVNPAGARLMNPSLLTQVLTALRSPITWALGGVGLGTFLIYLTIM